VVGQHLSVTEEERRAEATAGQTVDSKDSWTRRVSTALQADG
jgi:hypothetical protein